MALNEIQATKKIGDVEKVASLVYDFGGTLAEAEARFGAEVVYSGFVRSSVIAAQNIMRRYLEAGLSQEEIQAKMAEWKPGVTMERTVDPIAAIMNKMAGMSQEDKDALIAKLMDMK